MAISGSLALAVVPLVLGQEFGWPVWAWLLLAASVPTIAPAIAWERRLIRTGGQPLVDVRLFASRVFTIGLGVNAAFTALGMLVGAVALRMLDDRITAGWPVVSLALMGLGNGLILPSVVGAPLAGVPPTQAGVASACRRPPSSSRA